MRMRILKTAPVESLFVACMNSDSQPFVTYGSLLNTLHFFSQAPNCLVSAIAIS